MTARAWYAAAAATLLLTVPAGSSGQIADELRGIEDGTARFTFATKPGIEICAQGVRMGNHHMMWRSDGNDFRGRDCTEGRAAVEVEFRNGLVRDVEVVRPGDERSDRVRDLGEVTPGEAAGYFLSLVYRGATESGAKDVIFPAMIADVSGVWVELLDIARDRSVHRSVRESTLFWLGQEAAQAVTEGLRDVATDRTEDQEIRNSAIFALSQRDADESIPILMELARHAEEAETRRTAMFWLAQSDDPRVVAFFEDILTGRG